jgi:hypothetical protein
LAHDVTACINLYFSNFAACIRRFIEQFLKSSFFRAEAGGGGGLVFAADSTPNLFQLYKNQASML